MSTPIYVHAIIRYDRLSLYITVIAGLGNCTAAACMLMFLPSINSRATEHKDEQLLWVGGRPHNIATIVNSTDWQRLSLPLVYNCSQHPTVTTI